MITFCRLLWMSLFLMGLFFFLLILLKMRLVLVNMPLEKEICSVVFANPDIVPGPDGFMGKYFHACLDFISSDIVDAA